MIQLSRWHIRRICDVLRATVWAATGDMSLPVLISTGPEGLLIACQGGGFAVAHTQPGNHESGAIVLPGNFLQAYEGWSDSSILLQPIAPNRGLASWTFSSEGWRIACDSSAPSDLEPFPPLPYLRNVLRADEIRALHEAMRTADPSRPEWSRIELRGSGVVAATDGKQVLLQTGFNFPWTEDLLAPRTEVFDCADFHQQEGFIGRTDRHVVIQVGGWTVALPIDRT